MKKFYLSILLGLSSIVIQAQNTYTVNAGGGADFTTITAAIAAASSGDIILVSGIITGDGSAPNGIVINKDLTIVGQDPTTTIIQASTTESDGGINRRVFTINGGVTTTIKNLTIRHGYLNTGVNYDGGAGIKNSGTLFLENCLVTKNHVHTQTYQFGGGILTDGTGSLNINNSTISLNTASGWAGGICHGNYGGPGPIVLTNSTITNNSSPGRAGALLIMICTQNNIITNCTFEGNSSGSYGVLFNDRSSATYTNNTFVNNTCTGGGGAIYLYAGTMNMKNNLLANNTESGGVAPNDFRYQSGTVNDNGNNLIEYSANYTFTGTGDITGDQASLNISGTLADNGTQNNTQTLALNSGSVAIDAGGTGMNGTVTVPCKDQRGLFDNGAKDIGAYEFGATSTVPYAIAIETNPKDTISCTGQNVSFSVSSSNGLYYQWMKDGVDIPGATSATLTLNGITLASAGEYNCRVFDDCVAINSDSATLSVLSTTSSTIDPVSCDSYTSPSGNYTWTVSGNYIDTIPNTAGCDSIIAINLTVVSSPSDQTLSVSQNTFCPGGGSTTIDLASSQTGVKYYLRNDANDTVVSGPIIGTGNTISLNTGVVSTTTTYNVLAERTTPGALEFTGNPGLKKVSLGTNLYTDNIAGTSQLTIEAWVRRSSLGSLHTIFSNYEGSYPLLLRIDNDKLTFYINSTANVQSTNTIPTGVWTHVAATYTGSEIMVYINGVLEGSQSYNQPFISSSNELKIGGGLSNNSEYFLGDIADVRVWDYARSVTEISTNMNQILTGSESGLVANYQFSEGSGSTTANSAVSGLYSGTIINNPAWVAGPLGVSASCPTEMTDLVTISISDDTPPVPDVTNLPDITGECIVDTLITPTATDDCSGNISLTILPPTSIAGVNTNVGVASFGPQTFYINAQSVIAQDITPDSLCCDTIINDYSGKIAVMYRGACSFPLKVKNAQNAGAIGAIIVNNAGGTAILDMGGTDPSITIPAFMVSTDDGLALMNEINSGNVDIIMERKNPITITHNATLPITTPGTTVVTWTYDDGNGNTSTQNQNVIIPSIDNTIDNSMMPTLTANQAGASYRWLDCDNGNAVIPSETGQSFTATVNGNYAVEIIIGNCSDTSACESVTGVGVREMNNQVVSIYPNPTNGVVTVDLGMNNSIVNYTVVTIEGRIVEQGRTAENKVMIDLSGESKGVYFLQLKDETNSTVYKVLKQ